MSDANEMTTRELIVALRGGVPPRCDFCREEFPEEELHPEEAGQWICVGCINKDKAAYFGGEAVKI